MNEVPVIVLGAGLLIGIVFGAVGLLSGFCSLSGLRSWWIERDGRMIRTFALAMAVAVIATQSLAALGLVDLGKSLYLQPSFSPALILFGGLLFGYGMVLANGCASRAVVLLGQGNLRSLMVVVIIAVTAQMTLKGLIAPARLAFLNWSVQTPPAVSLSKLLSDLGLGTGWGQLAAVVAVAGSLLLFALADGRLRGSWRLIAAGVAVGLLVGAGWAVTGYLGDDDFSPVPVASLTFVAPVADTLQYAMLSTGLSLSFGIVLVVGIVDRQLHRRAADRPLPARRLPHGASHAALRHRGGADGRGRRDGLRLHDRSGPHGALHLGAAVIHCGRGLSGRCLGRFARSDPRAGADAGQIRTGGSRELSEFSLRVTAGLVPAIHVFARLEE